MTAIILDGKATAAVIKADLTTRVATLRQHGVVPGLGTVLVGDDPSSRAYVAGKQAYYLAQADAARKQAYAVSFVPPNLPQYATVPDPVRYISTTFLVSLMVYVIGSLLVGAFRDQAGL